MGGENCGEVGTAITVSAVAEYLAAPEDGLTREETGEGGHPRRQPPGDRRRHASAPSATAWAPPSCWRCGTRADVVIANVGDSRAYLYRAGELRQLSYDQNFANELRTKLGFSEERVRTMPNRNVLTMAVGTFEHVLVRTHVERLEPGDRILLCSDGLHGPVDTCHDCANSGGFREFAAGSGGADRVRQSRTADRIT